MTTEERVMSLFESANPVPEPGDFIPRTASDYLATLDRKTNAMTLTAIEPEAPEHNDSKRPWLLAAASIATLALIGGLIAAGIRADDDQPPADQPTQSLPAEPDTDIDPESVDQPEPTVPSEPVDDVGALAIGEAMISAVNERDTAAAAALLVDDATVDFLSARSKEDVLKLIDFFSVDGTNFEIESCQPGSSYPVTCLAEFTNELSQPLDGDPITGTFYFRIADAQIRALAFNMDRNFGDQVGDPWLRFIEQQHPEDFDKMIRFDADGLVPLGPQLTDESSILHDAYIAEYVAAITSE